MSDRTPTDEQVEQGIHAAWEDHTGEVWNDRSAVNPVIQNAVRAVLAAVGPSIAAQALRDAGDAMDVVQTRVGVTPEERLIRRDPALWLDTRADQIEKEDGRG